jgi:rRNA-processing protein FCF1
MTSKKRTTRVIPNLKIYPLSTTTPVDLILEAEVLVELVHTEVLPAIQQALKAKKNAATLFEINSSDSYIELPKSEWVTAIDSCISYYSKKERYELCTELTTLKSKLTTSEVQLA